MNMDELAAGKTLTVRLTWKPPEQAAEPAEIACLHRGNVLSFTHGSP
jgi:hypothetical protein